MKFHVLTLFPDMVMQGLMTSITGRAVQQKKIDIDAVNIRDYTQDKHGRVDDYPYGGGAGMLMQAQPVYDACQSVMEKIPQNKKKRVIYVTPQGIPFTQAKARELAAQDELLLLCGHYEGIDERVLEEVVTDYISIGDYVLTGGELAAMVIVDAVARLVPGVLGNEQSALTESFHGELLEHPQYSRPDVWHGKKVPEVLLSGNQKHIDAWKKEQSILRTKERRPDLYARYVRLQECRQLLMKQKLLHIDMIELINRGRAQLLYFGQGQILLKDMEYEIYFHACVDPSRLPDIRTWTLPVEKIPLAVLHQEEMIPYFQKRYGLNQECECYQAVYTRHEKLPVQSTTEVTELFNGTTSAGDKITFDDPCYDLEATGFAITESGANYAIVTAGSGVLNGKKYTHVTRQIVTPTNTRSRSLVEQSDNTVKVENATLVSLANATAIAERLAEYYSHNERINNKIAIKREIPGDVVQISHPYGGEVTGCIESTDVTVSGRLAAQESVLVGYKPQDTGRHFVRKIGSPSFIILRIAM